PSFDNGTNNNGIISGVLAEDPGSGVLLAYTWQYIFPEEYRKGSVARIADYGSSLWWVSPPDWANFPLPGIQRLSVAADGAGGAYANWQSTYYTGGGSPPYAYRDNVQRYSSSGAAQLPVNTTSPAPQYVERDGSGGAYLIGDGAGGTNLEVHRRLPNGSIPAG